MSRWARDGATRGKWHALTEAGGGKGHYTDSGPTLCKRHVAYDRLVWPFEAVFEHDPRAEVCTTCALTEAEAEVRAAVRGAAHKLDAFESTVAAAQPGNGTTPQQQLRAGVSALADVIAALNRAHAAATEALDDYAPEPPKRE